MHHHPYLDRPLRTIDQVLFERCVRSLMWEDANRDRVFAKLQAEMAEKK